jgi:hypothetical protein
MATPRQRRKNNVATESAAPGPGPRPDDRNSCLFSVNTSER